MIRLCAGCNSPVQETWMRYCRTCRAWLRFSAALRTIRATRQARTVQ